MLRYKLKSSDKKRIYFYFPEGNENAPGEVEIKEKGDGNIVKLSEEDIGNRYAIHAIKGIDLQKDEGTVAWY